MTNLALKANVQYCRLVKYVEWLVCLGAVQIIYENGVKELIITERGREILKIFYSVVILIFFVEVLSLDLRYFIDDT